MKIYFGEEEYNVPVIAQWQNYRYASDLQCRCGYTQYNQNIIGIAEINGMMEQCNECPKCFDKFRFHITHPNTEWKSSLGLSLHLHGQQFRIK